MLDRNCPNCSAPLEINVCKCPYCGTSYFDISAINIKDGEPFYLKFLTEQNGKLVAVTALVKAVPSINIFFEQEVVTSGLCRYTTTGHYTLNMTFESVSPIIKCDQAIIKIEVYDENYLTSREALSVMIISEPKNHGKGFAH